MNDNYNPIVARDADDPRLVAFYNRVISQFGMLRGAAAQDSDKAAAELHSGLPLNDAARAAYSLTVAETKLATTNKLEAEFLLAWLELNEPEPLGEIDPDLPRDPEWYDECDREDRDEDGNWDGDKTPYYKK